MKYETELGLSAVDKTFLIIIPPVIGALVGWFIPVIADWTARIPIMPFGAVLDWVASLEGRWVSAAAALLGILAGIIFIVYVFNETLKINVTDAKVKLCIHKVVKQIDRDMISAIYMDGKDLVILSHKGKEIFREQSESKKEWVSKVFRQHLYPWKDHDPFASRYQRWVANHPQFPQDVNALLSARERAMQEEEAEEAKVLRKDLAELGVVIHDENKRQYVRMIG
ncbi:YqeB family protein [Cytobacillus gottheilii]|uniref:50S ribosomal protein L29 n=1 Tax=Cytobacillus gottheilii TaxID=859144 RepID=A0ABX8FDP0_9BACI|nr:hypothetical protein [Cytobacillus gottheilii]QVY61862.1 50S ribosomal protein L29 [Cytobacillus gottheilii]